ncbi:MAG: hypothetical protein ACREBG_21420 [Pyrinomonadaceae bacterium]
MKVFDTDGNLLQTAANIDTLSNAVSVLSNAVSGMSQKVSVLSNAVSVLSQAVSALSQQVSVLSQGVSALSQAVSVLSDTVSAISARMDTISNANSVNSAAISVLSNAVSVLSQTVSVMSNTVSAISARMDTLSNAVSVVSQAQSVLSNAVSVLSQTVSAMSNTVSAISARMNTLSNAVSVLSNAVSVLSATGGGATRGVWTVRGLSAQNNATSAASKYNMAANAATFYNPTTSALTTVVSIAAVTNDTSLSSGGGDNGRDQSAVFAAASWIYFYLVLDGTTVKSRSSLTAPPTGPTLIGTESSWAFVGAVAFPASALEAVHQNGAMIYYDIRGNHIVLNGGTATVETAVGLSAYVPPNTTGIMMEDTIVINAAGSKVMRTRIVTGQEYFITQGSLGTTITNSIFYPNIARTIYYLMDSGLDAGYLIVTGYRVPNGDS